MHISKKAALILVPTLLVGAHARAWSANSDQAAANGTQVVTAEKNYSNLLDLFNPVAHGIDSRAHAQAQTCKVSEIYSRHDVVGDPESCIMGRYVIGGGASFAPATAR
jgi:hypothetical protein